MLEWLSAIPLALWLDRAGLEAVLQIPVTWQQNTSRWVLYSDPTVDLANQIDPYLKSWSQKSLGQSAHGVWLQSGEQILFNHQGKALFSGASLTKVATTLAALKEWGPYHQFTTQVAIAGKIEDGVVEGDLVIIGGGDPLLVWQEAIAMGQQLHQLGITQVTGDLIITGPMWMNYKTDLATVGELFYRSINADLWDTHLENHYRSLPHHLPRPQVAIAGSIRSQVPPNPLTPVLYHRSLALVEILRRMNVYSHNRLSETIAQSLGGGDRVEEMARTFAGIPAAELHLINGSGLGQDNRMSPRASVLLLMAIQSYLQFYHLSIADIFPVVGYDGGTIHDRQPPLYSIVKTGTLSTVSALAGVIFTRDRGLVWFSIMNQGWDIEGFRLQQDELLGTLARHWGGVTHPPERIHLRSPLPPALRTLGHFSRDQILIYR
ncbi:D-alanyl-D-alanine carboxypeptidase [Roseofilum sp. BLCC_M91]|uniref:D-alanyl-D-alanine carboxypeptidase n=1 Tax=Roseofilum halophilum BLCC-M91 TaxID=3022259 RepID=A0ABT7BI79_9CYAN|nr:D-alanyl-D-alanine carboxypeptidase [Roseofilum halophilum]MDJ1178885.1 D-alanyl-D-alanine carboxypeptidase [Roseofilum halophilum BLCC-M91]